MSDETLGVADITEILRLLPHRYPFLLIDRVIDIRGVDHGSGITLAWMRSRALGSRASGYDTTQTQFDATDATNC